MTARARIHYGAGVVVLAPMPDDYPHADLCSGHEPCRGCGGEARREFPMPASHRRRIPRLHPLTCHDCIGTGMAHAERGSVIHRDLRTRADARDLPVIEPRPQTPTAAAATFQAVALAATVDYPRTCRCGQLAIGHHDTCDTCRAAERAPQGTQDRLFTPTAAPIPGQLQL